jgi:hypothetical protein
MSNRENTLTSFFSSQQYEKHADILAMVRVANQMEDKQGRK